MKTVMMTLALSLLSLNAFAGQVQTFANNGDFDIQIQVSTCRDQVSVFYYNMDWSLYGSYHVNGTIPQGATADQFSTLVGSKSLEVNGEAATYDQETYRLISTDANPACAN
jgi:hypothetical protein